MLNKALEYHKAGLRIVPYYESISNFCSDWGKYRDQQSEDDVRRLFSKPCDKIALLCTDYIEAIDIDTKHDPKGDIHNRYFEALKQNEFAIKVLQKCVIQSSKNGGKHIIYRAKNRKGNTKLARIGKKAIIETRGKGGALFVNPSPGYKVQRGKITELPLLTDEERNVLISFAKSFDEVKEETVHREYSEGDTPWDAFNEATDVQDMIEAMGWTYTRTRGKYAHYTKPGGTKGETHATVHLEHNYFYPWTTDVPYEPEKGYSPYHLLTVTEYNGDFKASAKALAGQGFGKAPEQVKIEEPDLDIKKIQNEKRILSLIDQVEKTKFDYMAPLPKADVCLWHIRKKNDGTTVEYPIAGFGMIGCFTGHEKAGKSFIMGKMASSHLASGFDVFTWRLDLKGRKMVFVDTEQSKFFYSLTQKRIYNDGYTRGNTERYAAYHLRQFSAKDRMAILEYYVKNTDNLGALFIDGFVDLIENYNDLEMSQFVVNKLMEWSDKYNILIMGGLHLNKGDGKIRGHLGSEVKNKAEVVIASTKEEQGRYQCSNPTGRFAEFPSFEWYRERTDQFGSISWTEYDEGPNPSNMFPVKQKNNGL